MDLGCYSWEPTPPRLVIGIVWVGASCMFNCIICVDRMDGNVSSSNYTKESDLFKTQRRQPAKINVHACSALFATSLNEGAVPFPSELLMEGKEGKQSCLLAK